MKNQEMIFAGGLLTIMVAGVIGVVSLAKDATVDTDPTIEPRNRAMVYPAANRPSVTQSKKKETESGMVHANKSSLGPKIPALNGLRKSVTQHVCENGGSCFGGNLVDHSTSGAIPFQRTIQPGLTCPNCAGQMYVEIWTVPKN